MIDPYYSCVHRLGPIREEQSHNICRYSPNATATGGRHNNEKGIYLIFKSSPYPTDRHLAFRRLGWKKASGINDETDPFSQQLPIRWGWVGPSHVCFFHRPVRCDMFEGTSLFATVWRVTEQVLTRYGIRQYFSGHNICRLVRFFNMFV